MLVTLLCDSLLLAWWSDFFIANPHRCILCWCRSSLWLHFHTLYLHAQLQCLAASCFISLCRGGHACHSSLTSVFFAPAIGCLQCEVVMALETVQSMLEQRAQDSARFLRFALSDYVVSHPLLRWCPGPNCSIVFQAEESKAKKVSCSKCSTSCW